MQDFPQIMNPRWKPAGLAGLSHLSPLEASKFCGFLAVSEFAIFQPSEAKVRGCTPIEQIYTDRNEYGDAEYAYHRFNRTISESARIRCTCVNHRATLPLWGSLQYEPPHRSKQALVFNQDSSVAERRSE